MRMNGALRGALSGASNPAPPPAAHSARNGARPVHVVVRFRIMRALSIVALCIWGAPRLARAAAPAPGSATTESWPLAFTRAVHAARLRARGATITVLPRHRLQQTPNDCALAVVDELQRAARRPMPDRAWLARALALGVAGVPLDSLAPTLRRLGWFAHTTRGAPCSEVRHPCR